MPVIYSNNASTTLSAGINNSTTTIGIASASGFPSIGSGEYYFATIANTNNTKIEVVKVTAGTTSLTVTRAQDGTTAQAFDSGDNFQLRVTAATLGAATKTDVNITGGAIAGAAISNDAIDSQHYADGSIDTAHIADDAVTTAKIADDNVTAAKLANSINTDIATGVTANTTANAALPKAGGTMTGNIDLGDNNKLLIGTGNDLEIYHDGTDSYIADVGTGNLELRTNGADIRIMAINGSEYMGKFVQGNQVELYYNNSKKFETASNGSQVNGQLVINGDAAFAQITLQGNDGTADGYIYAESGDVGILDGDGNWAFKIDTDSNMSFLINNGEEMRLEADGDLHVDGDVIAFSTTVSDERLKDNIEVVEGALDKVKELKGVTFTRKQDGQKSAGVIAQDVEKVLPEAVKHKALPLQTGDDELFKTVQYDALHALLIESIKELSARVEELESK